MVTTKNGDKIIFAWSGIKHALNAGLPTWQEAGVALHIENLIESSEFLEVQSDKAGRE